MAIAEKWLAARYNKPGFELFGYRIYALNGDGCMMEGISSEAASLAGHLKLDNLCWIYDNNRITIEGKTDSHSPKMSLRGSLPTDGTSFAWGMPMIWIESRTPSECRGDDG
jgi:transketolase